MAHRGTQAKSAAREEAYARKQRKPVKSGPILSLGFKRDTLERRLERMSNDESMRALKRAVETEWGTKDPRIFRKPLSLEMLRLINRRRCEGEHGFKHTVGSWSECDWACAMAGEAGEFCNAVKKRLRERMRLPNRKGRAPTRLEAALELADVVLYADLCAARMGYRLEDLLVLKFNEVSEAIGARERLR